MADVDSQVPSLAPPDVGGDARFAELFEQLEEGVAIFELVRDADGRAVDYRVLDVNAPYELQLGRERGHVLGRLASVVFEAPPPHLAEFAAAVESGSRVRFERYGVGVERQFSTLVIPLRGDGFATVLSDTALRKSHEEALEKGRLAQRALLDNQPHLAWLKDGEGRFLAVNKAFADACGKGSPESLVGKTDYDAWPRALAEAYRADDAAVMASGRQKAVEEPIAGIDGTRWFETYKSPVFAPDGSIVGTTGVARDVTLRKLAEQRMLQAEDDRRKMELSVMQAQKLESLGVLAGGIAHDFNNLLTSILGSADLAAAELPPSSSARRFLDDIERASRRAADLCRQMLAYSGKGRFVIQALSLNDLVTEMAHLLSVSISKKVVLRYDFAANLPSVMADATQIRQVVMNLITNASEAIGDRSGFVSLASGAIECDAAYLQTAVGDAAVRAPGQYVYLDVSDTGQGMDAETVTRIFDPFFSTKFTGRGLGLAAVLGIVRGHKGMVRVESVRGRGTTFRVLLPAHDLPAESLEEVSAGANAWRGHGLVLLADDEETVRSLTKRMLEHAGFEVVCAADGREAIALFSARRDQVRLVVLDWTMPHVDGEACLRELLRLDPTVKVIMTSGYNEQEIVDHFLGKGLAGFVQKPYKMADLLPKVRLVLESE